MSTVPAGTLLSLINSSILPRGAVNRIHEAVTQKQQKEHIFSIENKWKREGQENVRQSLLQMNRIKISDSLRLIPPNHPTHSPCTLAGDKHRTMGSVVKR